MKIVFFGDSITDGAHQTEPVNPIYAYGMGFVFLVANELMNENPNDYEIINKGISANRVLDLYARVKADVWEQKPDVVSILIGINDLWTWETIDRFAKTLDNLVSETKEKLPEAKIILCEPYCLHGTTVDRLGFETFDNIRNYAVRVKEIAKKYEATFVPLQKRFDELSAEIGYDKCLFDGVHPTIIGANLIKDEWIKAFKSEILKA